MAFNARPAPARRIVRTRARVAWLVNGLLAGLLLALPAAATPVTVVMTGVWNSVTDTGGLLGGAVTVGGSYTATLTYDDAVSGSISPPDANYFFAAGEFSFTLSTGGFTFSSLPSGSNEIDLSNYPAGGGTDSLAVFSIPLSSGPGLPAFDVSYLNPLLENALGGALTSLNLTDIPWTISAWPSSRSMILFAGIFDGPEISLDGTIDELTVVPEHGTLGLVAIGLAVLAQRARRRR